MVIFGLVTNLAHGELVFIIVILVDRIVAQSQMN